MTVDDEENEGYNSDETINTSPLVLSFSYSERVNDSNWMAYATGPTIALSLSLPLPLPLPSYCHCHGYGHVRVHIC